VKIGSGHTEFAKQSVGDRFVFSDFNIAIGSINIENVHFGFSIRWLCLLAAVWRLVSLEQDDNFQMGPARYLLLSTPPLTDRKVSHLEAV
jgi:hypothetical protein